MAVISGFHVDDYCVPAFRDAVRTLQERLSAEKITDFQSIAPGHLVARIPPKIKPEGKATLTVSIPVFHIKAVGDDFDDEGNLVRGGQSDYLYFEASVCYLLDLNLEKPRFQQSSESVAGVVSCFDAREVGRLRDKYRDLPEELKGIPYRIPAESVQDV